MITFLTKSDVSEGFEQIINFLNASVIQYALVVNPTIYVSCIKQFWSAVLIKKMNDVVRLQALIDRRKDDKAEPAELTKVIEVVTTAKLMIEVDSVAAATTTATTITAAPMPIASASRRRKGVFIRDPEETATPSVIVHSEPKSKDKGKGILDDEAEPAELTKVIEVVTTAKLMIEVDSAAAATTTATTITTAPMPIASASRRRKGVFIRDPEETATPSVIV
nr:hypothetical protein [Tanacetum cinerariifolium]